jgi:polar amino acid transport system ATP-binding protein
MLVIENLKKCLASCPVLNGLETQFSSGERVAVLGASGGGKTTFLRCLSGLLQPDEGRCTLNGVPVSQTRPGTIGLVSQNGDLFHNMNVYENVCYAPIHVLKFSPLKAQQEAETLLKELHIFDQKNHYPSQLSGGQKQRAAIARTLAMHPQVILFDEPTSALDPVVTLQVIRLLQSLSAKGILLVIASHDLHFVQKAATRVLFLNQGKMEEDTPNPTFFQTPQTAAAKTFLESAAFHN